MHTDNFTVSVIPSFYHFYIFSSLTVSWIINCSPLFLFLESIQLVFSLRAPNLQQEYKETNGLNYWSFVTYIFHTLTFSSVIR